MVKKREKKEKEKKAKKGGGQPDVKEEVGAAQTRLNAGTGEESQIVETGTEDRLPTPPGADERNAGSSEAHEAVTDERSAEGPQSSVSEGDGDSPGTKDSEGEATVSPPDETGTGEEPPTAPDVEDHSAASAEAKGTVTDEGAATSESDGQQIVSSEADSGSAHGSESEAGGEVSQSDGTGTVDKPQDESKSASEGGGAVGPTATTASAQAKEGLSDEQIEEIVAEINSTLAKTADKGALDIGTLLLDKLFKGKLEEAFSRSPYKDNSFKNIADHSDIAADATTLARWVKAADLVRWFQDKGHKFSYLTCSHYIALLKLRSDPKVLVSVANEAERNRLSVRELKRVIAGPKPATGVLEMLTRHLANPGALLKDKNFEILSGNKLALSALKDVEITNILDKIESQRVRMQEYMTRLIGLDTALSEIREERRRKKGEILKASLKKDESAAA